VGVMLQDGGLYTTARPLELVSYLARLYPDPADPAALLSSLGLDPGLRTPVRRLSGGEQQRVKCAAALVGRPELAFLDEPTAGLDAVARRAFHDLVRDLVRGGTTIVLTTHLMDDVERLADTVVVVAGGRAVRQGSIADFVGEEESVAFRGPMHADLSGLRAVLPPGAAIHEDPAGHYRVTGAADPMVLSAIASWCAQHGVRTADLSVGRRSLEDVIVDLVGEL
jgi:ABC-2 type transport system ATP-binding protein